MSPTIRSKTPCPECGGTRWRRWGTDAIGEMDEVIPGRWATARVDWMPELAGDLDCFGSFDVCARCGLVIR